MSSLALISEGGTVVRGRVGDGWPLAGRRPEGASLASSNSLVLTDHTLTYEEIWRQQPWVRAVTSKLSRAMAAVPLKAYTGADSQEHEYAPGSALGQVLRKPYTGARTFKLIEFIVGSLCIHDKALLVKSRGGRGQTPNGLWPVPWRFVTPIPGERKEIDGFLYVNGDVRRFFFAEDCVFFTHFAGDGGPVGVSPLEALRRTLAAEDAATRYQSSFYTNQARPASFIVADRKLNPQERKELRAEIEAAYGGVDNAFRVGLLDSGMDWKPIAFSAQESQFIDQRKFSREEVCAVYDIPPPILHILDNATYSNITEQHWMFYMDTLTPLGTTIEQTFMAQVIDVEPAWDGFFTEFDFNSKMRGNYEQRTQSYQREFQSGGLTPNEHRKLENRDPIGDPDDPDNPANHIYLPVNMQPVGPNTTAEDMKRPAPAAVPAGTDQQGGAENDPSLKV